MFRFLSFIKKIFGLIIINKKESGKNEDLKFQNKEIDESKDESLVQVDLPFNQVQDNNQKTRLKYKLPSIDFLKLPTKKERRKVYLNIRLMKVL